MINILENGSYCRKILIIHMGALGDILLSLPAMQMIRNQYKNVRLDLLGNREVLKIVAMDLNTDYIHSIESNLFTELFREGKEFSSELIEFFDQMESVFLFTRRPYNIFVFRLQRILHGRIRLIPCFPPSGGIVHVAEYQLDALNEMGNGSRYLPIHLNFYEGINRLSGVENLKSIVFNKNKIRHIIGIHPGSGSRKKCWPKVFFKELIKTLALNDKTGFIVFFGPAEEEWRRADLEGFHNENIIFLLNKPLKEIVKYLKLCHIYIGNDSGMTHLASSLGISSIAIFGPTDPKVWRPLGPNVMVVSADIDCAPCKPDVYLKCDYQRCLESIHIKDVAEAVKNTGLW